MNFTLKTMSLTAIGCLVIGFFGGFIPEYIAKSHVETKVMELTGQGEAMQSTLRDKGRQLQLNEFALQAAVVSADATASNYADASASASALFTGLRQYVDRVGKDESTEQIQEVLKMRDATIAGLAKADPSTRQTIAEIFEKLKTLSTQPKS
ncbi:hypothetical protein BH10ACI4_BH10ACI4_23110 [soil metagenome]